MSPYTASHEPPYACCPSSSRLPDSLSPSHLPLDPFKEAILCQQLFELQSIGMQFTFNHHICTNDRNGIVFSIKTPCIYDALLMIH